MSNEERVAMFNKCKDTCPDMSVELFGRICDGLIAFEKLNPKQQDYVINYMKELIANQ